MQNRFIPLRSGRRRGHNVDTSKAGSKLKELNLHARSSPKDRKLISRPVTEVGTEPAAAKRRRGEPAPIGGFSGKPAADWSVYRENRRNVKRKPEARRKSARKKRLGLGAR